VDFISQNRLQGLPKVLAFSRFLNDLHETNEILKDCDEFPDLSAPGLRDRLQVAIKGNVELEKETPEKGHSRNFLFELVMAGILKRAGFEVHVDRIEDVYFELSHRPIFLECKRMHSEGKLSQRIGGAARQIGKRCDDSGKSHARGIIALDVSKILNPGPLLFECSNPPQLDVEAERLLEVFRVMHKSELIPSEDRRLIAVYVYFRFPFAMHHPA